MPAAARADDPRLSVLLPARNAGATIEEQLRALSNQTYSGPWELLVIDNGCTDDTLDVVARWIDKVPTLRVVDARDQPGLAHARNVGVRAARADVVMFCDADDEVDQRWLEAMSRAIEGADLVSGHLDVQTVNDPDVVFWRGGSPTEGGLKQAHGYLGHAVGANFAIRRSVYLEVGGCDERFRVCSDDVDLSWRVQEAGHRVAFAPDAVVRYRLRAGLRDAVRQQWIYGRAEALLYRKFRPRMRRQRGPEVAYVWFYLVTRVHQLVRGRRLRGWWLALAAYRLGRLRGSFEQRVLWW
jgi:glycosyltransferase involved in cell wall biosynthesis